MKLYYYTGTDSLPTSMIILPTETMPGVGGDYQLQKDKHNGAPVYKGEEGVIFVKIFNSSEIIWVFSEGMENES